MGHNTTLKPGKKTKAWARERAKLKPRFEKAGITACEFRYGACWHHNGLTFAHYKKRLNLKPGELGDPKKIALACINCHQHLEGLPEAQMTRTILDVIAKRICQP